MIFETNRLLVRHWRDADLEALHELYGDPAIVQFIKPPLAKEETEQIFSEQLLAYNQIPHVGRYMIIEKQSGECIGIFMLREPSEFDGVEIGYSLKKQNWGKGYATEIVKKGVEFIFDHTNYNIVYAFTDLKNFNSKNVLSKCGFIYQRDLAEDGKRSNLFALER